MFLKCFINFNKYVKSFKKYINLFGISHEIHITSSEIGNPGQEFYSFWSIIMRMKKKVTLIVTGAGMRSRVHKGCGSVFSEKILQNCPLSMVVLVMLRERKVHESRVRDEEFVAESEAPGGVVFRALA